MGPLLTFLSSVTWAIGVLSYSKLSKSYTAPAVNTTRLLIGMPLFLIMGLTLNGVEAFSITQSALIWFVLAILGSFVIGDYLFLGATQSIGVPSALAISSSFPIWSALYGVLFLNENLQPSQWLGFVLVLLGIVYVILSGERIQASGQKMGYLFAGLASLGWALNTVAINRGGVDLPVGVANTFRLGIGVILCPLFGKLLFPKKRVILPIREVKAYFWVFLFECFFGSLFFMYGIANTPIAVASVLASLAPVISVPLAWITRSEPFSGRKLVGILGVTGGLWLLLL